MSLVANKYQVNYIEGKDNDFIIRVYPLVELFCEARLKLNYNGLAYLL